MWLYLEIQVIAFKWGHEDGLWSRLSGVFMRLQHRQAIDRGVPMYGQLEGAIYKPSRKTSAARGEGRLDCWHLDLELEKVNFCCWSHPVPTFGQQTKNVPIEYPIATLLSNMWQQRRERLPLMVNKLYVSPLCIWLWNKGKKYNNALVGV